MFIYYILVELWILKDLRFEFSMKIYYIMYTFML